MLSYERVRLFDDFERNQKQEIKRFQRSLGFKGSWRCHHVQIYHAWKKHYILTMKTCLHVSGLESERERHRQKYSMAGAKVMAEIDLCSGHITRATAEIVWLRGFKQGSRASTKPAPEGQKRLVERCGSGARETEQTSAKKPRREPQALPQAIRQCRLDAGIAGTMTCPLFAAPDAKFLEHLEEQGFAILIDVMTAETLGMYDSAFWAAMQGVLPPTSPFNKPGDRESWRFPGGFRGATWCYGLAQSDFAWILRENRAIRSAFEAIHGTKKLVVSLDAIIAQATLPRSHQGLWLHKDQRPSKKLLSVQAVYTRYGGGGDKGGTCCVPRSHRQTYAWEEESDHFRAPPDWWRTQEVAVPVLPPNSAFFFNSRLVHANVPPKKLPEACHPVRVGGYVSWCPASRRSPETLELKTKAYRQGQCCSHWADECQLKKTNQACGLNRRLYDPRFLEVLATPEMHKHRESML